MRLAPWHSERERATKQAEDCRRACSTWRLIDAEEGDRFGRYLLRGRLSWAEVVTVRGGVLVCGDVSSVLFQRWSQKPQTPRGPLYWMAHASYGYATEKASIGDSVARTWDEDCARGEILYQRRHRGITREQARRLWDATFATDGSSFAHDVYDATGDSELCRMGVVTDERVFMAQAVLARLVFELEARDFRAKARSRFLGASPRKLKEASL